MSDLIPTSPRRIEFSEQALNDLEEIWFYFSEVSETAADKTLKQITEKFPKLRDFPQIGRERNDLLVGLRSFPAGKHIIFIVNLLRKLKLSGLFTAQEI